MESFGARFLAQSWRDLWRNRRRTLLTGLAMLFASFAMVPFIAMGDGGHQQMIESATNSFLGHMQIQHRGYRDDPDLLHRVTREDLLAIQALLETDPEVEAWAPRITGGALASRKVPDPQDPDDLEAYKSMSSEGAILMGVSPVAERRVSTLEASLLPDVPQGRCLNGCRRGLAEIYVEPGERCEALCRPVGDHFQEVTCTNLCQESCRGQCPSTDEFCAEEDCVAACQSYCSPARFLSDEPPDPENPYRGEAVLGTGLAELLQASVGDDIAVTSSTAQGRTYGAIYRVVGHVKTNAASLNRSLVLTHHDKLSAGLEVPGSATGVLVRLADLDQVDEVERRLDSAVDAVDSNLAAMSWKTLAPELEVYIQLDQGSLLIMLIILTLVVGVIIANVVTMSVMERTREFGVRLALGESPTRIAASLVTEVTLLAGLSSVAGALLGEALTFRLASTGIDFGFDEMQGAGLIINSMFYPLPTLYGFLFPILCVMGLSLLGAVLPSLRMKRLRPVDALRFE